MNLFLATFADLPPPPPPPPLDGALPIQVLVALGLGALAAVSLLVFLWRRTPAPTSPVSR